MPPAFAEPEIKTLANGLTVFLNPIEGEENIAVVLAYHAGADAQTAPIAGVFKFLEYALFNGPATKPGISEPALAIDVLEPNSIEGGSSIDRFEFGFSSKKENLVPPSILCCISFLKSAGNSFSHRQMVLSMPDRPPARLFRMSFPTAIC